MAEEFIFDSDDLVLFCAEFDNIPTEEITDSFLDVTLEELNQRWTNVQRSYKALFVDQDEKPDKIFSESSRAKYIKCTKSYQKTKSKVLDLRKAFVTKDSNQKDSNQQDSTPLTEDYFAHIKVPPCDTDVFYGSYEEWPAFRDMFTAVYIDNPRIPNVQKLYYLRLKVQGRAASIIRKYQLCAQNFSLAWDALRDRYENKRILVENQIKVLLNLPAITVESSKSLQKLQITINDCLAAINAQDVPTEEWDPFVIILCASKLPVETLSLWEQSLESHRELVKWEKMDRFLSHRCEVVERIEDRKQTSQSSNPKDVSARKINASKPESVQYKCKVCGLGHPLKSCPQFLSLDPQKRNRTVSENRICTNCLAYTHLRKDCPSKFSCSHCKKNHHSLLHFFKPAGNQGEEPLDFSPGTSSQNRNRSFSTAGAHVVQSNHQSSRESTLLPTAIVQIFHRGEKFKARAFLDQGSERTFISKKLQQQLMLPTEMKSFQIHGIGGEVVANSNSLSNFTLYSEQHNRFVPIEAIVIPKITRMLPRFSPSMSELPLSDLKDIELADPAFYLPNHVDILIGADVLPQILIEGVKPVNHTLLAQRTIFGWIISGPLGVETISAFSLGVDEKSHDLLGEQLRKFWEEEEVSIQRSSSKDDEYCEALYRETTFRNSEGRYVVRLPFKQEFGKNLRLGASRQTAMAQYLNLEHSLKRKGELAGTYTDVIKEYLSLNHMKRTISSENISSHGVDSFYLPHHAVIKPDSRSTKVRVVFNASKKTSSGLSLNDVLHTGPTLQADLMSIILNWRLYRYVFNGDIEKMYRQILVHEKDTKFQRILFRLNSQTFIQDFALKTVTFGVNCAPYLAIRTLMQLAHDSVNLYPQAAYILTNETYVDDILSGAHNIQSAIDNLAQLINVLKSAGFPLKKITSNCHEVLKSVPSEDILDSSFLKFKEASLTKTLGIQWDALSDSFSYTIEPISPVNSITKRQILSNVAKLFDPAGWISPIVVQAKMLLQQIWLEGTGWDEDVKPNTLSQWNNFVQNLSDISTLKISRWINFAPSFPTQIHGFCDASEKAYCAAVYFRVHSDSGYKSHLFASKTKVAPINPVSLPRLELCGAVLLSKLVKHITSSIPRHRYDLFLWSDSSIVLGWLRKPPSTWKTYVANRTAQIIRNVGNETWHHVPSAENPADLGSRGCDYDKLHRNTLWWRGPCWLQKPPEEWPKPITIKESSLEMKRKIENFHMFVSDDDLLNRFSKWDKAIRVMVYVFRFLESVKKHCAHQKTCESQTMSSLKDTPLECITQEEFSRAKNKLINITQRLHFSDEYTSLSKEGKVSKKSSLYNLNPFLDENDVIRTNGRIANSIMPFNERHPIILPANSFFCKLFIDFTHRVLMHAEMSLMLRAIRGEYFVPRLKPKIRLCIRQCVTCVRYRQNVKTQIMGALPVERSSFSLPFTVTGLDFAGPFSVKTSMLRNAPYHKGYVCVFVCFSTRAIHLELCSDLTTNSFLAAFTRFTARRGLPKKVMSDNGTNFVGAERILRLEYEQFISAAASEIVKKYSSHGFQWHFIPPSAPHMGGLWEAGVKSFKIHFRKVSQNNKYTFEEFTTLLTRIESLLNSRPLSPMSDDPNELLALTPGHFLRGAPIIAPPEAPSATLTLRNRWERLKILHHQFAQRWKDEYLKELQRRYKWQNPEENIEVGQLVVVKDDLLPPNEWRLGRISNIHVSKDGYVRVADIKTQAGVITRAITKLVILPVHDSENN